MGFLRKDVCQKAFYVIYFSHITQRDAILVDICCEYYYLLKFWIISYDFNHTYSLGYKYQEDNEIHTLLYDNKNTTDENIPNQKLSLFNDNFV